MLAQVLIAASFAIASYQDVKERAVHDLAWVPALVGAGYVFYASLPGLELPLIKLALVGGIALAFTFFGAIGQADGIALALIACDPYPLSPIYPLFAGAGVALGHIAYEFAVGNARGNLRIPMETFLREQRWIPKAIVAGGVRTEVSRDVNNAREEVVAANNAGAEVEVSYGVPTVAYLGVGYVIFLAYLAVFNFRVFMTLP